MGAYGISMSSVSRLVRRFLICVASYDDLRILGVFSQHRRGVFLYDTWANRSYVQRFFVGVLGTLDDWLVYTNIPFAVSNPIGCFSGHYQRYEGYDI